MLDDIVAFTIVVLTRAKDHREEWWKSLSRIERDSQGENFEQVAVLAMLARPFVEGANAKSVEIDVPEQLRDRWAKIVRDINKHDKS